MSKYQELCKAFSIARNNFTQYQEECHLFAQDFWSELIKYFKIPKGRILLHFIDEYGEIETTELPIINAMQLRNDAFFEFGIGITLCEKGNSKINETFILPIHTAIDTEGTHKIRLGEYGSIYKIDTQKKDRYKDFLDALFNSVQSSYLEGLTEIRSKNTLRRIGFK